MHAGEFAPTPDDVARLLGEQFPGLRHLPVERVHSIGTVNAVFRLGDDLCARLPLMPDGADALRRELYALPIVAPHVTLAVPEVIGRGEPDELYPLDWAVYRWLPGQTFGQARPPGAPSARALAGFVRELRSIPVGDAPGAGRRPLAELDDMTVAAIERCAPNLDVARALDAWGQLVAAEPWDGAPVWIHADLLPPNLLVRDGALSAVIDFGSAGAGDPAFDVVPAWTLFEDADRDLFRRLLGVDDATWHRAKAYALHQAVIGIPYYRESNPQFVSHMTHTANRILAA